MERYCDIFDKTTKKSRKEKYLQRLTHNDFSRCIRRQQTLKNLNFVDLDSIFHDSITNHSRKTRNLSW